MPQLLKSLQSWGSETFKSTLKEELQTLSDNALPLHHATTQGGKVDASNIAALINSASENNTHIQIKVGIFFNEIIAGCNCDDDPMSENTYCELLVSIDKSTAEADFNLK
ncbi:glucosamine--fructose-6-phosphate aminotransferase [sulfur-oxidizing endosymbiont of Gigantopelta aegis]|uniref:glucosamine--fructose-6-phosphate aminotransferase n=1 Tax=sulfur-oxidizing endosymbiont of Gigantopelta aegis TaxID=2794934 RepID=UPI0018DC06DD|nr:glucosamine--fructose-6-phosphate aminotransferase [sulfur-oxidizing endosymbiont of Gigantopelta aegis]